MEGELSYLITPEPAVNREEHARDDSGNGHMQSASERAYWEGLTQDLAGLMAIHHVEDIVVMGQLKDAFIQRFAGIYQVYLFPSSEPRQNGFEAAIGAAIIAEGLYRGGIAGEVLERLHIREASASLLHYTWPEDGRHISARP